MRVFAQDFGEADNRRHRRAEFLSHKGGGGTIEPIVVSHCPTVPEPLDRTMPPLWPSSALKGHGFFG